MKDSRYMPLFFKGIGIVYLAMLLVAQSSCYEKSEGCLDINATNFDVGADEACADCCQYPQLKIGILHRRTADDTTGIFSLDSIYPVLPDSTYHFLVNQLYFYLSEFELIRPDGSSVEPSDSIPVPFLQAPGDTLLTNLNKNLAFIDRRSPETKTIGRFGETGSFSGISFKIGLGNKYEKVIPYGLSTTNPLGFQRDSVNWEEDTGYVSLGIDLVKSPETDSIPTQVQLFQPETNEVRFFPLNFEILRGFDIYINLRINYLEWFRNLDFTADTDETIQQKIVQNITNSVELVSIEQR